MILVNQIHIYYNYLKLPYLNKEAAFVATLYDKLHVFAYNDFLIFG